MTSEAEVIEAKMDFVDIPRTGLKVSRVAIGTWAIGGWMWGGTEEAESVSTIRAALDHGVVAADRDPRAQTNELGDVHEAIFENRFGDDRSAVGD